MFVVPFNVFVDRPPKKPLPATPPDDEDGGGAGSVPHPTMDQKLLTRRAQIAEEMYSSEKSYYDSVCNIEKVVVSSSHLVVFHFQFHACFYSSKGLQYSFD